MTTQNSSSVSPALIADQLAQAHDFLLNQLCCADDRLRPFVEYLGNRQGKMLRASVLLLSGELFGEINHLHIKIAAVIEMIHAATLLHDDVIDNGQSRRHHATANSLWGANMAVLLGDYILSKAFVVTASLQRNDINMILADTAATICQGEMLQNTCRGDSNISVEDYLGIIEKKTAVFFAACARLGGIIAGAEKTDCDALYDFGLNLGLSFQMTDDLIDIVGTENETGKTGGRDVENEILTLPAIKGIDFTKSQIAYFRQKAVSSLDRFGQSPAAAALKELASSMTQLPL
ncbi:MAG: polyprenyl synthetase family protein [Phycisphaerae bacterium]|jgi:geranylgeranyl pyrophosphate synthase